MKSYISLLVSVLLITSILIGCQTTKKGFAQQQPKEQLEENQIPGEKTQISAEEKQVSREGKLILAEEKDPRDTKTWTKINSFTADLDSDGNEETLELYTSAERDSKGNIMWDDGQNWLLFIQDGNKFYTLLSEYVQLGSVYFTVAGHGNEFVPKVTVIVPTGANLTLNNYVYDKDKQGYREEPIYDSKVINHMFTSIPGYR